MVAESTGRYLTFDEAAAVARAPRRGVAPRRPTEAEFDVALAWAADVATLAAVLDHVLADEVDLFPDPHGRLNGMGARAKAEPT